MSLRIKGQETEIVFVVNGEVQGNITEVQSFEASFNFETKEEGYLGEKSNRFDEVYNGTSGTASVHHSSGAFITLLQYVKQRAQRQSPGTVINVKSTMNFPSGEKKRLIFVDVFFDPMNFGFGGRTEYGASKLDWKCSEFRVI